MPGPLGVENISYSLFSTMKFFFRSESSNRLDSRSTGSGLMSPFYGTTSLPSPKSMGSLIFPILSLPLLLVGDSLNIRSFWF